MVLVVLIGGVAGWMANKIRTQRRAIAAVQAAGGRIRFDFQGEKVGMSGNRTLYRTEPTAPKWVRRWLGDELFQSVKRVYSLKPTSPDQLADVARFDGLEYLSLSDATKIGDGLRHLRGLSQLHRLWITPSGVTDVVLTEVAQIPSIRELILKKELLSAPTVNAPATDQGFIRLANLMNVETLEIKDCPNLTDSGASRMVEGMPRLRSLFLEGGPVSTTATLPTLARAHPDLQSLGLDRSGVTDDDLKALEGMARLQHLQFQRTSIGDAGMVHLQPLKDLVSLLINSTNVTDQGMKSLGQLTSLKLLLVNNARVTDAGLANLEQMANLKHLAVGYSTITDSGMSSIARIVSLERLELNQVPLLTDAGLIPLEKLKNLKDLSITETKATPEGIATLRKAIPTLSKVATQPRVRPTAGPAPSK